MKKLVILLAGLSLASANTFAGELTSLTHEAVLNDYDGGKEHTEWTLGKGSYKINDKFKFTFDVDKDFITEANGTKYEGWDTQFGITQSMGKLGNWDLSLNYLLRYDDKWNVNTHQKTSTNDLVQYIVSPYFSKNAKIAGKDFSLGVELWAQVGGNAGTSMQANNGGEVNFYLDGALSDKWNLNLALYNLDYYNGKEYDYQMGTEDYLTYTLPLKGGFNFVLDNKLESYYTPDTEAKSVDAYVKPMIKYSKKVNENLTLHTAVAYEVLNYTSSSEKGSSASKTWDDNEMEITLGFKVK